MMGPGWYLRRLSRMGPVEVAGRVGTLARTTMWRRRLGAPLAEASWLPGRTFVAVLPPRALDDVSPAAVAELVKTADRLLEGHAEFFGVARTDMVAPDWTLDPKTGRRAPADAYAFDVPYRDENAIGDIKQIWEPSRHHHLTVLAAAYAVTGEERYAQRVAEHLTSWWAENPPLRGVHWISGIELGIRLLSWVWVRRLLDGWSGTPDLFERNPVAVYQIHEHQRWLAAFPSRGSSANNHLVAELAGRVAAAAAFPWFAESPRWLRSSVRALDAALRHNTFPSGLNRELATEYHGLVMELGLAAAAEAGAATPAGTWETLARTADALATVVDATLRPPRQGDADDGRGLVVDGDGTDRWASLLATGDALFGRRVWWPAVEGGDVRTTVLAALAGRRDVSVRRPATRPLGLPDAGLTILRSPAGEPGEIWCRCDGGPHGFGSIAAHGHADALSVEVRHNGVDILADPGTYCYHGEPEWRGYFRSTLGHNTLELDGTDQSTSGGPFLWVRHARSRVVHARSGAGGVSRWIGQHTGYRSWRHPVVHQRTVELDAPHRTLRVVDELLTDRRHVARLAFHLGPSVTAELDGNRARLGWTDPTGVPQTANLTLPAALSWKAYRGQLDPPLGWYSPTFGRREPSVTLIGQGLLDPHDAPLSSEWQVDD